MLRLITCCSLIAFALPRFAGAEVLPETTLTHEGQKSPAFKCTPLDGKEVDLKKLRGKVVLIGFFTTNCGPCIDEMPSLEKEVWQKFKDKKFAMLVIGRGHENKELGEFAKQHQLSFPLVSDPKQKIYKLFATMHVPRNYVIDAKGSIVFQSVGYDADDFAEMIKVIQQQLEIIK
ncbi:MAG: TlpA disulfide reductase family protein [Verrucomicrobiota bacterium]